MPLLTLMLAAIPMPLLSASAPFVPATRLKRNRESSKVIAPTILVALSVIVVSVPAVTGPPPKLGTDAIALGTPLVQLPPASQSPPALKFQYVRLKLAKN